MNTKDFIRRGVPLGVTGQKLLKQPVTIREMPVNALIRNTHGIPDWEPFVR
jgi:hypothetical protein